MKFKTAIRKANEGIFEFIEDPKMGNNIVRYQIGSGRWKTKVIHITDIPILSSHNGETNGYHTPEFIKI